MAEYIPTTEEIRDAYAAGENYATPETLAEFDRWLATHDAEVLRAAAVELEDSIHHLDPAHPSELSFINCTRIDAKLLRERADRAEVRTGVVAEEPEWEIGYQLTQDDGATIGTGYSYPTIEEAALNGERRAKETNEDYPMYPRVHAVVVRRVKAGPWVPVKQEGAGQ